ncbi:hypothetical protein B5G52_20570 [Pseudoalteromonas sp. A601]|uniref:GGDEF domain-containing protein n=1 Tax=Pseudoalteromonas sp. A601 TaxID=1967839 RepID=UPI000B3CCA67|nr:GGDEF domain-containing protein [Pseudoalteromonas sp. A601]OUS68051.1 hypothetical protein B5G52_20570 [Pseudoalteromonas sp. A601]
MLHLPTVIGISLLLNILISCFFLSVYFYKKQRCYLYFSLACGTFAVAEVLACLRLVIDQPFITHYLADLFIIASPLLAIIGLQKVSHKAKPALPYFIILATSALVLLPLYDLSGGQLLTTIIIATLFLYAATIVYKINTNAHLQQKILLACFSIHSLIMFIQAALLAAPLTSLTVSDFTQPLQVILINHLILATATAVVMPFVLFADLEAKLQRLVNRDSLTNLLNRRGFFINGDKISKELKSHKHAFSVVMIDIDHFKKVNDQYGHSTGDMAIKWIAQHILNQLNDNDIAARIGGEEFAILLPEQTLNQAKRTTQNICVAIRENTLKYKGNTLNLSVSAGVSCCDTHTCSIKRLLEFADKRLYIAKSQGRDQVVSTDQNQFLSNENITAQIR